MPAQGKLRLVDKVQELVPIGKSSTHRKSVLRFSSAGQFGKEKCKIKFMASFALVTGFKFQSRMRSAPVLLCGGRGLILPSSGRASGTPLKSNVRPRCALFDHVFEFQATSARARYTIKSAS